MTNLQEQRQQDATIMQMLEKFKKETAIPAIVLTATYSSNISTTASKFTTRKFCPKISK